MVVLKDVWDERIIGLLTGDDCAGCRFLVTSQRDVLTALWLEPNMRDAEPQSGLAQCILGAYADLPDEERLPEIQARSPFCSQHPSAECMCRLHSIAALFKDSES